MKPIKLALTAALVFSAATLPVSGAFAAEVGGWASAWGFPIVTLAPLPAAPTPAPVAAPAAAPAAAPGAVPATPRPAPRSAYNNSTVRQIVRLTTGGDEVRVRLSNEYGATGMRIGAAHIALVDATGAVVPGSDRPLTFNGGATAVTISAYSPMISDAAKLKVAPLQSVAISLFLPEDTRPPAHRFRVQTAPGDQTAAAVLEGATSGSVGSIVAQVEVKATARKTVIVAFGDSITEGGVGSTALKYNSWPDALADRIAASPYAGKISVVNAGISGNRLLREVSGASALARFDRDVGAVAGATHVIVLEGINDIGNGWVRPAENPTLEELIGAYKQIILRAHDQGLKVYGGTLLPYAGAKYDSPEGEAKRKALNAFIRAPGNFDGYIDFEKAVTDPANPDHWLASVGVGDNLHPNVAGYEAMAKMVDLKAFAPK